MNTEPLLTPSELSALTDLSVRRINKLIDEQLPSGAVRRQSGRRLVTFDGAVCLALDREISPALTMASRKEVYRFVVDNPDARVMHLGTKVRIQISETRRKIKAQGRRLRGTVNRLTVSDPEVLGGLRCFRGSRVPVYLIAELLEQGAPTAELLEDYPALTHEMVEMTPMIARAHPRRGRPPKQPWQGQCPVRTTRVKRTG